MEQPYRVIVDCPCEAHRDPFPEPKWVFNERYQFYRINIGAVRLVLFLTNKKMFVVSVLNTIHILDSGSIEGAKEDAIRFFTTVVLRQINNRAIALMTDLIG
jgi:hypothetical protein